MKYHDIFVANLVAYVAWGSVQPQMQSDASMAANWTTPSERVCAAQEQF